ncbi:hypothetical protein niasHS_016299 [Heterodera schachtii]|uniref:Secreted protein n=1 Tax=Heterodera schachtii TaxID=97005 RepID=A0ABD2HUQ2_HETSC
MTEIAAKMKRKRSMLHVCLRLCRCALARRRTHFEAEYVRPPARCPRWEAPAGRGAADTGWRAVSTGAALHHHTHPPTRHLNCVRQSRQPLISVFLCFAC